MSLSKAIFPMIFFAVIVKSFFDFRAIDVVRTSCHSLFCFSNVDVRSSTVLLILGRSSSL